MALNFEARFDRVEQHLVGLWKFRVKGQKLRWCCTFTIDGFYHDTWPKDTPEQALDAVYRALKKHGEI